MQTSNSNFHRVSLRTCWNCQPFQEEEEKQTGKQLGEAEGGEAGKEEKRGRRWVGCTPGDGVFLDSRYIRVAGPLACGHDEVFCCHLHCGVVSLRGLRSNMFHRLVPVCQPTILATCKPHARFPVHSFQRKPVQKKRSIIASPTSLESSYNKLIQNKKSAEDTRFKWSALSSQIQMGLCFKSIIGRPGFFQISISRWGFTDFHFNSTSALPTFPKVGVYGRYLVT